MCSTFRRLLQCDQLLDQFGVIFFLQAMYLLVVLVHLGRVVHGAEFWATHRAESGLFVIVVRQGLIVHGASSLRIEREGELLFPIELKTGVAEGIVTVAGAGAVAGNVSSMRGDLVGDDAIFHVFVV